MKLSDKDKQLVKYALNVLEYAFTNNNPLKVPFCEVFKASERKSERKG